MQARENKAQLIHEIEQKVLSLSISELAGMIKAARASVGINTHIAQMSDFIAQSKRFCVQCFQSRSNRYQKATLGFKSLLLKDSSNLLFKDMLAEMTNTARHNLRVKMEENFKSRYDELLKEVEERGNLLKKSEELLKQISDNKDRDASFFLSFSEFIFRCKVYEESGQMYLSWVLSVHQKLQDLHKELRNEFVVELETDVVLSKSYGDSLEAQNKFLSVVNSTFISTASADSKAVADVKKAGEPEASNQKTTVSAFALKK